MVEVISAASGQWWWRCHSAEGGDNTPADQPRFSSRSDAESWVGEFWQNLADSGVASVSLLEGDQVVYGPMSLNA